MSEYTMPLPAALLISCWLGWLAHEAIRNDEETRLPRLYARRTLAITVMTAIIWGGTRLLTSWSAYSAVQFTMTLLSAPIWMFLGYTWGYIKENREQNDIKHKDNNTEPSTVTNTAENTNSQEISDYLMQHPDQELLIFRLINDELEKNLTDKGLWTKSYFESNGDDRKTKIAYIQARRDALCRKKFENGELE